MKRIFCFVFALGLALSLVVPAAPASADYQSQSNFWQWVASNGGIPQKVLGFVTGDAVCPDSEDGKHHASSAALDRGTGHFVCTCAYCGETYNATYTDISNAYTDTLDDSGIRSVNSSGAFIWYPSFDDIPSVGQLDFMIGLNGTNLTPPTTYNGIELFVNADKRSIGFTYSGSEVMPRVRLLNTPSFICPVSGVYTEVASTEIILNSSGFSSSLVFKPDSLTSCTCSAGGTININFTNASSSDSVSSYSGYVVFPTYEISSITSGVDDFYSPVTRSTVMTGDYSVVGDNNEVFHHEETIFNEDNSMFYNPVTDTSSTITNWNYDYSTRTYTMTDDNGQEKILTYGDDNIVINDGGNTFTFYYGNVSSQSSGSGESGEGSGSGSGSGDSGDSSGLLSQVGRLLGTLVSGLLGGITAFLSAILSALTNLVEVIGEGFNEILDLVLQWLAQLPLLFEDFLHFLEAVFDYLPFDIVRMLSFGVACVVFVGILKALRR